MRVLRGVLVASIAIALVACNDARGPLGDLQVAEGTNAATFPVADREPAPSIAGEALREGDPAVTDALIADRVAVVNFWGSWCGPCRLEEPILEAVWQDLGPDQVAFVGVNTRRDQRAAALAFLDEFDVTYPSVYDPSSAIAYAWGVRVMPATFVVDAQGRIAAQVIGAIRSEEQLRGLIQDASGR